MKVLRFFSGPKFMEKLRKIEKLQIKNAISIVNPFVSYLTLIFHLFEGCKMENGFGNEINCLENILGRIIENFTESNSGEMKEGGETRRIKKFGRDVHNIESDEN